MPPNNTIVARLTADPRDMQRGFSDGRRAADDFASHLARVDRQVTASTARLAGGAGGGGRGTRVAQSMLELSRGLEDANVGFQLQGIQGAVRGSMNNLAAFATMLGGPVIGAVTTFAAVGLSALVSWWGKNESATKSNTNANDEYAASLRKLIDLQVEAGRAAREFARIDTAKEAKTHLDGLQERLAANRDEASGISSLGNNQTEEQLRRQFELTQQRATLEREIEASKRKQAELTARERQEAENEMDRRRFIADVREKREDAARAQDIVQQGMGDLAPNLAEQFRRSLQIRELSNLNLPPEMQDQLAAIINTQRPRTDSPFASFVREGTQEAAKLDFQDAQKTKDREIAQKQFDELKKIHDTLEEIKQQNTPVNTESINLD